VNIEEEKGRLQWEESAEKKVLSLEWKSEWVMEYQIIVSMNVGDGPSPSNPPMAQHGLKSQKPRVCQAKCNEGFLRIRQATATASTE